MSHATEVNRERAEAQAAVRLRVPERRQMAMVVQCPDDLVPAQHPVRMVMALVDTLDLSRFSESIKAREGVAGGDATDPRLLVGLWLYACIRGMGSARELARRCEESAAFRWLCGGVTVNHRLLSDFRGDHGAALEEVVYAGDRVAGGQGTGVGEPREPGRSASAGECGGGQFSPGKAVAQVAEGCTAARRGTAAAAG